MTMRPDDCSLTPSQLAKVRAEAGRALREAGALGVFPTPIDQILDVAKVQEIKEDVLNPGFVAKMRSKAEGALKSALSKVIGLFDAVAGFIGTTAITLRCVSDAGHHDKTGDGSDPTNGIFALSDEYQSGVRCECPHEPGKIARPNAIMAQVGTFTDTIVSANSLSYKLDSTISASNGYRVPITPETLAMGGGNTGGCS